MRTLAARIQKVDARIKAEVRRLHRAFWTSWRTQEELPDIVNGITFWRVGRNASHMFSVGTKDARRFVRTFGEEGCDWENDEPIYVEHIREVTSFNSCYLGHY